MEEMDQRAWGGPHRMDSCGEVGANGPLISKADYIYIFIHKIKMSRVCVGRPAHGRKE